MRTIFRCTDQFFRDVRGDLARPHAFAAERVAFISIRATSTADSLVFLAEGYHPIADEDYLDDPTVGAMMSQEAIRKALDIALLQQAGMVHVHMHEHMGRPTFSRTDRREQPKFVPDFFKVRPQMPHGAVVLSHNMAAGRVWLNPTNSVSISEFNVTGPRMTVDTVRTDGRVDFEA
jgi:hypothetical protein